MKTRIRLYFASIIIELLRDKDIEKEGVQFVTRLFEHKMTHEGALILLKNLLKDEIFIQESKVFATNLIQHILM